MSNLLLTCLYCNHSWKVQYTPSKYSTCIKCKDRHLTIIDLDRDKIDYYSGTVPYKQKKDLPKEKMKESDSTDIMIDDDGNLAYVPGNWD